MPSQNNEEKFIREYFGDKTGRFLEIGSFHPELLSNTHCLVQLGWPGTYVEPAPSNFNTFLTTYRDNPMIELVNAAVSTESKLIEFYDSGGDAVSTSELKNVAIWGKHVNFRKYWTRTITWTELLDAIGTNFSFLSLDVEGTSARLFEAMPFERLSSLKMICVEHDSEMQKIDRIGALHGFKVLGANGENMILAK